MVVGGKVMNVKDIRIAGRETGASCPASHEPWNCSLSSSLFHQVRKELEVALIRRVLAQTNGNISQAARRMQLGRRNLQKKISQYGIHVAQFARKQSGR